MPKKYRNACPCTTIKLIHPEPLDTIQDVTVSYYFTAKIALKNVSDAGLLGL